MYIYSVSSRLVNVRLDADRLRKARKLRDRGVALSDVVREAIDERFLQLKSAPSGDVASIVRRIFEEYPDPPDLPPREYHVHDRTGLSTGDSPHTQPHTVIIIDTGPLVALCDARDSKHRLAVKHLQALARHPFVTCDAVLTEACFHLSHRVQRQRLAALLRELNIEPIPAILDSGYWFEVLDWFAKYADQDPDWADGCLAVAERARRAGTHLDVRQGVSNHMAAAEWNSHPTGRQVRSRSRKRRYGIRRRTSSKKSAATSLLRSSHRGDGVCNAGPRAFNLDYRRRDRSDARHGGHRELVTPWSHVVERVLTLRIGRRRKSLRPVTDDNRHSTQRSRKLDLSGARAFRDQHRSEDRPPTTVVARDAAREGEILAGLIQWTCRVAVERTPRTVWRATRIHEIPGAVNERIGTATPDSPCHDLDHPACRSAKRLLDPKPCPLRSRSKTSHLCPPDKHPICFPERRARRTPGARARRRGPPECGDSHHTEHRHADDDVHVLRTERPPFLATEGQMGCWVRWVAWVGWVAGSDGLPA